MIDWKKPFDGLVGMLLFCSLIGFGVAIGLSIGIALDKFHINDAIANLLGGMLGAGLGAAGGIFGAMAIYEKQRRDQLHALLDQALIPLTDLQHHLMGWSNACLMQRNADNTGANPGHPMREGGRMAQALVAVVALIPGLPKPVNDTISMHIMSLRMDIDAVEGRVAELLASMGHSERAAHWKEVQTSINAIIEKIGRYEAWLRGMI